MKFNKAKRKVLHLGQGNPKHKHRLDREWVEGCSEENDLGQLVDEKVNMTQQCALAPEGQVSPGLHQKQHGQQVEGGDSAPPLCSGETPPGVLRPALELSAQERHGPVVAVQRRATNMVCGLEHLCCEERLRELGLFSVEKRRLQGDLKAAFQYLKGPTRKLEINFLQGCVVI